MIRILFFLLLALNITSCAVQKARLFKIPRGVDFVYDTLNPSMNKDYKIAVGDKINFSILTNNGESMFLKQTNSGSGQFGEGEITVKYDSTGYLPLIGNLKLVGLTTSQLEEILKREFSKYINDPYVKLAVSNSRIVLFKGYGSSASIIPLNNNKTTILEVIAMAGGIPERGDARKIKLVRFVNGVRKIYIIDLSTIDKIANGDMLVQSNDYIYIETSVNYVLEFTREFQQFLAPLSVLISSVTLYKTYIK